MQYPKSTARYKLCEWHIHILSYIEQREETFPEDLVRDLSRPGERLEPTDFARRAADRLHARLGRQNE